MELIISNNCISCGLCAEVCPASIIKIENKMPKLVSENCLQCGHCEAYCPTDAIRNSILNHDEIKELPSNPVIDSETAELFLRSRRSIRNFTDEIVTEEEAKRLVNIGRYAETGSNSQSVSYMVILNKNTLEKVSNITLEYFKNNEDENLRNIYLLLSSAKKDVLFRGAPSLILALTPKNNPYVKSNPKYALTYIELFAPTLNLGTCWAGFFERFALTDNQELNELLEIPNDLMISGALMLGHPKFKSKRVIGRNALEVTFR